jgi:hypothetical protein
MKINTSVHQYSLANTDLKIEMKMNKRMISWFPKNIHIQCHPSVATASPGGAELPTDVEVKS